MCLRLRAEKCCKFNGFSAQCLGAATRNLARPNVDFHYAGELELNNTGSIRGPAGVRWRTPGFRLRCPVRTEICTAFRQSGNPLNDSGQCSGGVFLIHEHIFRAVIDRQSAIFAQGDKHNDIVALKDPDRKISKTHFAQRGEKATECRRLSLISVLPPELYIL